MQIPYLKNVPSHARVRVNILTFVTFSLTTKIKFYDIKLTRAIFSFSLTCTPPTFNIVIYNPFIRYNTFMRYRLTNRFHVIRSIKQRRLFCTGVCQSSGPPEAEMSIPGRRTGRPMTFYEPIFVTQVHIHSLFLQLRVYILARSYCYGGKSVSFVGERDLFLPIRQLSTE